MKLKINLNGLKNYMVTREEAHKLKKKKILKASKKLGRVSMTKLGGYLGMDYNSLLSGVDILIEEKLLIKEVETSATYIKPAEVKKK